MERDDIERLGADVATLGHRKKSHALKGQLEYIGNNSLPNGRGSAGMLSGVKGTASTTIYLDSTEARSRHPSQPATSGSQRLLAIPSAPHSCPP